MCFDQKSNIYTRWGGPLKLVDRLAYLRSSVSSTEKDINTRVAKAWTAIDRLSVIWKSDLTDKIKYSFFQAMVVLILLYGCTTWTLTKRMEKKLDGNYTRMLQAAWNKVLEATLYNTLPPITKTIQVRQTRHSAHCWRSKDKLIRDIFLWTPSHGRAKVGRPTRTYIQQLSANTKCNLEDLQEQWTIGTDGERRSVRSMLAAQHYDDDMIQIIFKQIYLIENHVDWMFVFTFFCILKVPPRYTVLLNMNYFKTDQFNS